MFEIYAGGVSYFFQSKTVARHHGLLVCGSGYGSGRMLQSLDDQWSGEQPREKECKQESCNTTGFHFRLGSLNAFWKTSGVM